MIGAQSLNDNGSQTSRQPSNQCSLRILPTLNERSSWPNLSYWRSTIGDDAATRRRSGSISAGFPDHAQAINDALNDDDKRTGAFVPPAVGRLSEVFPALEIIELLGAGGMGAVYKARQKGLDRLVALKILPEEFAHDVKFALRFTREARTLAKLNHPNIVSVFEFGNVQDTYYFLMEFVDGPTLRDVISAGQLSPEEALAIVPHLCDALQFAHDKGVIHRDIKPENILIAKDGSATIADFGLSRILGDEDQPTALTGTHQIMGTLRYMAPEQLAGARSVDHRADIYSLGVVFYELLTGELPIGRFELPSKKVSIDVRLDEVVLRTLEKEPQHRYQAASEIKSDMDSIASSDDGSLAVTLAVEPTGIVNPAGSSMRPTPTNQNAPGWELGARTLLARRELLGGIERALRPLFRWQIIQIIVGVLLIGVGAYGWAPNTDVLHQLVSGLIVHVYGVVYIIIAIVMMVRIKRVEPSRSVDEMRAKVGDARRWYLRTGPLLGFPWCWMWIPVSIAAGFDPMMQRRALIPSLVVGIVGFVICWWLNSRVQRDGRPNAGQWKTRLAGKCFRNASQQIDEIQRL